MTETMTYWKSRQSDLKKTLAELILPPADRHVALTQVMAHLSAELKQFTAQAQPTERAAGEAALVQMSLAVAREINALRKTHPEVMKEAKPPPAPSEAVPRMKAAAPPPPASPPPPQGPSLFSRAASWLSRSVPAAADQITNKLSSLIPSPKTLPSISPRFAAAASLTVVLSAGFKADTGPDAPALPLKGQAAELAIKIPLIAPVTPAPARSEPPPAQVTAAVVPAPAFSAPIRRVEEEKERKAVRAEASAGRTHRMDDLFHQEEALGEALDKLEQMPVDEAFSKAVLVESGDKQHDAAGRVVTSHKGATGAAQVMPDTAKIIAKGCTGKPLDQEKFRHDKNYNKSLGRCYYKDQYERYSENPILAALAYNMGYGNLDKHISRVGDPTKGEIGMVDFIKKIRITETRHYVLHMLGKAGFIEVPKSQARTGRKQRSQENFSMPALERRMAEPSLEERPRLIPVFEEARQERAIPAVHFSPAPVANDTHQSSDPPPAAAVTTLPEAAASGPAMP